MKKYIEVTIEVPRKYVELDYKLTRDDEGWGVEWSTIHDIPILPPICKIIDWDEDTLAEWVLEDEGLEY